MAFSISTFQLLYFPRYQGSQIYTRGPTPFGRPIRRNFFTQSQYFTISNCVFNFNILALVVSEILGRCQIYVRGPCAPQYAPQRKFFGTPGENVTMSNGFLNFNFLALVRSEILGGSQIYNRGPYAPWTPLAQNICTQSVTSQYLIVFLISTFQLQQLPRFYGVPNLRQGALCPLPSTPPSGNFFEPQASMLLCLMAFLISTLQLFYFPRYQWGPKFILGGHTPPERPLVEKFFLPKASTSQYLIVFLILTFQLQQFQSFQGVPNLRQGALCPLYAPRGKIFVPEASTLLCLMVFSISTF